MCPSSRVTLQDHEVNGSHGIISDIKHYISLQFSMDTPLNLEKRQLNKSADITNSMNS